MFDIQLQILSIHTSLCKGVELLKLIGNKLTLGGCLCEADYVHAALRRFLVKRNVGKKSGNRDA